MLDVILRLLHLAKQRVRGEIDPTRLVRRGMRLGDGVYIGPRVMIDPYHCWLVSIGDGSVIAPGTHILAHDASTKVHLGYTKIGEVRIGRKVFVGADSLILPGVHIGDGAIVGAGSVVRDDVPPGALVFGNPARVICTTAEYIERHGERLKSRPRFGREGFTQLGGITAANKQKLRDAVQNGTAYVE
jgi:maltose O-acetyltransferase